MKINFTDHLNYFIFAFFSLISSISFFFYKSELYNKITLFYNLLIIFILFIGYILSKGKCRSIIQVICVLFYLYILLRMIVFSFSPEVVQFPLGLELSLEEINYGLAKFSLFLAIFLMGIILVNGRKTISYDFGGEKNFKFIIICLFVCFLFSIYFEYSIFSRKDVSVYSLGIDESANLAIYTNIFTVIISADVLLFLILYYFQVSFYSRNITLIDKRFVFIITLISIIIYISISIMLGSRGAGIRVVLFIIALFLVLKNEDSHFKFFVRSGSIVLITVALNLLLFPLAEQNRSHYYNSAQSQTNLSLEKNKNLLTSAVQIFNRLGVLDYFIITSSREVKPVCKEKYLTFSYATKVIVNFIMPGDPFEDAKLKTPEIFGICYSEKTIETMKRRTSEIWTLPGIAKHYFGSWKYVIVFLSGTCLALGAVFLQSFRNDFSLICYSFYVFISPNLIFFSMGIDHSLNTFITFLIRLTFAMSLLYLIYCAERYFFKKY